MPVEQGIRARLIRIFGFFRKELVSVFRQKRLVLTLIVAPFLILLIFGLGYDDSQPPFRTLLVVGNEKAQLAADGEDLSKAFGGGIILEGTTTDLGRARTRLRADEVDLLIVAPDDALDTLERGEQANFQVIHGEIDPVIRSSIELLAELSVDEINQRVLADVITVAQEESEGVDDPVAALETGASSLVAAIQEGDEAAANETLDSLREEVSRTASQTDGASSLYAAVAAALGSDDDQAFVAFDGLLAQADSPDEDEALAAAQNIQESISELDSQIARAQELDPNLLVRPFGVDVVQANDVTREAGVFYSPGTLVVLVQHLAVTFAALSLVRERQLGLTNVFKASPLTSGEALVGKFLGFGTIALGVAAALSGAMLLFGIRFRGSVIEYSLILVLLIVASLGVGYLLSALSKTDTQAVQYSMIVLLLSIFFTGFVLPLSQLAAPVRVISYLIPATYGIQAVHDVVFRGSTVDGIVLAGLTTYAVAVGIASWLVMRRDVKLIRQ